MVSGFTMSEQSAPAPASIADAKPVSEATVIAPTRKRKRRTQLQIELDGILSNQGPSPKQERRESIPTPPPKQEVYEKMYAEHRRNCNDAAARSREKKKASNTALIKLMLKRQRREARR